jgi:hypothetical protein
MRIISGLLKAVVALILLTTIGVAGIRFFSDGPIAVLPGGPMSGEVATSDFPGFGDQAGGVLEFQVSGWRPSSRTVIGMMVDGDLYIPAVAAERKWWPAQALADPNVIIRHNGVLYPRTAARVTDPDLMARLRDIARNSDTALPPETMAAETTWFFNLAPR